MKIVSYNIARCSQDKIEHVLDMNADIYVLPESACSDQICLPEGYEMTWVGNYDFKGLGVIWKRTIKCFIAPWIDVKHNYVIPLIVNDKWLLLAVWPTILPNTKKTYPQILLECLKSYSKHIVEMPTMITGDFNCYIGQGGVSKRTGTVEQCIEYMGKLGLYSVYHRVTQEEFGKESTCTYHHLFREDLPFFIDFSFTNIPLKNYKIGDWERNISDHNAQIIEI